MCKVIDAKNVTEPVSLKREQVCCRATGHASFPTNQFVKLKKVFCASSIDQTRMIMNVEMGRLCKEIRVASLETGCYCRLQGGIDETVTLTLQVSDQNLIFLLLIKSECGPAVD